MTRKTKYDWMTVTMEVLVTQGVDGITIDALTKRLGVTKGSFYHHFSDMPTFRQEILALGVHTGPGIVGAGVVPMAEFEGLL